MTIKSLIGGSYAGTQNPSGAVAKTNQNSATQAPTVIIQATASIQIKTSGQACTLVTNGVAPNQSADEGIAILADRSTLLSCQAGKWTPSSAPGQQYDCMIDANYPMYICVNKNNGHLRMKFNNGTSSLMTMGSTWGTGWNSTNVKCSTSSIYTGQAGTVQCTNVETNVMCFFSLQYGPYNWSSCMPGLDAP